MKTLAIILDSFCAYSKFYVEKITDYYFIPLKVIVDEKEYKDGIDLSSKELMQLTSEANDVKTSQPSPGELKKLYEKLSKEYENIIFLPTPSAVSGTAQAAEAMAKNFPKVHVVKGYGVGKAYFVLAKYLKNNQDKPINDLLNFAHEFLNDKPAFIIPKNNDAFIKGGRIGKTMAFLLKTINAVPIISLQDTEKLKKKQIKRSGTQAIKYAVKKMLEIADPKKYNYYIAHTLDMENASKAAELLREAGAIVDLQLTAAVVKVHAGDGAISISAYRKLEL